MTGNALKSINRLNSVERADMMVWVISKHCWCTLMVEGVEGTKAFMVRVAQRRWMLNILLLKGDGRVKCVFICLHC